MYDEKSSDRGAEDRWQRLGQRLQSSRQEQGLSLEELQQRLKIWAHQLEALERGDIDQLPNPSWARGLTTTYANSLGLEGESLAEEYFPDSSTARPARHRKRPHEERPSEEHADEEHADEESPREERSGGPPDPTPSPLRRHWKEVFAAALGATVASVIIIATAILFPYNPVTGGLNDFLHRIAPGTFWGTEPQRVAVLEDTQLGATGEGNVITVKVAQDGVGVLSLPRNTLVNIPGHGQGALGDALTIGGPDLARRTTEELTGLEVPAYFAISAEGLKNIVNETGGVQIDVPNRVSGRAEFGGPVLTLNPGPQTLDGEHALVYLQGADLLSDAQRAERQQAFVSEVLKQALGPRNLISNPATVKTVLDTSRTNMSALEALQLVGRLRAMKDSSGPVKARVIPGQQMPNDYWVPDTRRLPAALKETMQ